jgi:AcrR family transcriptional regulator
MPRVSAEYRAARREQVLVAARRAFAANGFHATSMDDVIGSSGLSAGAVYQYFRSKDELIVAVATEALGAIRVTLDTLDDDASHDPVASLSKLLESWPFVPGPDGVDVTRIALHGWSEAIRNPALHAVVEDGYAGFQERVERLVARWHEAGTVPTDLEPAAVTPVLLSLILGYVVQRALFGAEVDPATYEEGLALLLS